MVVLLLNTPEKNQYSPFHNLFSLTSSRSPPSEMKILKKRKSYSTFSLNSMSSGKKWKSWRCFSPLFFHWTELPERRRKISTRYASQLAIFRICVNFTFPMWSFFFIELSSRLQLATKWKSVFSFLFFHWAPASPEQNEKTWAKTTFFIELTCRGLCAERKKK